MSNELVSMVDVSKSYPVFKNRRSRISELLRLMSAKKPRHRVGVLSDINLKIVKGQSIGIVGENGAGKSTLLKLITGILMPDDGEVSLNCKIGALLELGAGFNEKLSGRENILLSGVLAGLGTKEINRSINSIIAFADIGDAIDEPVAHYSSGMVVRLGFAIITAIRPELLITDEILAVGDESFQKKCIQWIEEYLEDGGTLLLVSHSMYHVQKLCQKAIWLHNGKMEREGDVFRVTQEYLAFHRKKSRKQSGQNKRSTSDIYKIETLMVNGQASDNVQLAQNDNLELRIVVSSPDSRPPNVNIGIVTADLQAVYGVSSDMDHFKLQKIADEMYECTFSLPTIRLLPGFYQLRVHSLDPEGVRLFDTRELDLRISGNTRELGCVQLDHTWS